MKIPRIIALGVSLALLGAGCGSAPSNSDVRASATPSTTEAAQAATSGPLALTSSAFKDGEAIPEKYTCNGQDYSPPLTFVNIPPKTVSLALTMQDLDAPFDHWVLFNIAPGTPGIPEGDIPPGSVGVSASGRLGYEGPCPSEGSHRYSFKLYALNRAVYLQDGTTREELMKDIQEKIIQTSELTGTYGK